MNINLGEHNYSGTTFKFKLIKSWNTVKKIFRSKTDDLKKWGGGAKRKKKLEKVHT
jgi:hypothetical protein